MSGRWPIGPAPEKPGDLVVGDDDGFVSLPFEEAEAIHALAAAKFSHESTTFADIGKSDNNAQGYRKKLVALGCSFE